MSLPLLQQSPSVALEVGTDRQLRADAVRSVAGSNALKASSKGLYLKRGRRLYGWSLVTPAATQQGVVITQLNQVVNFNIENLDAGGMFDVVVSATRITMPEAGRWFTKISLGGSLVGGTAAAAAGVLSILLNGSQQVCGAGGQALTAGNSGVGANANGYVNVAAGDYLEVYWRWLSFQTLTATSCTFFGTWTGMRVSA